MEILYIAVALIVILFVMNVIVLPNIRFKKMYTLLSSFIDRGFVVEVVKSKNYDFILESKDVILYIKYTAIPSNSSVTINSKSTWRLQWGGSKNRPGKSYPHDRYLNELSPFLKETIKKEKPFMKVIILYPSTEKILMYLNESDLDIVDIKKTPYGYKVTTFENFVDDFNEIINIK